MNIVEKILSKHLVEGKLEEVGETISLNVDEALTQDATGTLVYLQFEALKVDRIKIPLAVSFVDHNTLQIIQKQGMVYAIRSTLRGLPSREQLF